MDNFFSMSIKIIKIASFRQETVRKEREQRAEQRRAGLTADLKGFVDMTFVTQLVDGGFPRAMAIRSA